MKVMSGMLKQNVDGAEYETLLCPYMVGDIFITTNSVNPETRYKGTKWQKIEDETFLMSASETYPVKSTGGENEHTLTVDEMPSHNHDLDGYRATSVDATSTDKRPRMYAIGSGASWDGGSSIRTTGGGEPHNNMPKFFAVYMWLRVA